MCFARLGTNEYIENSMSFSSLLLPFSVTVFLSQLPLHAGGHVRSLHAPCTLLACSMHSLCMLRKCLAHALRTTAHAPCPPCTLPVHTPYTPCTPVHTPDEAYTAQTHPIHAPRMPWACPMGWRRHRCRVTTAPVRVGVGTSAELRRHCLFTHRRWLASQKTFFSLAPSLGCANFGPMNALGTSQLVPISSPGTSCCCCCQTKNY